MKKPWSFFRFVTSRESLMSCRILTKEGRKHFHVHDGVEGSLFVQIPLFNYSIMAYAHVGVMHLSRKCAEHMISVMR